MMLVFSCKGKNTDSGEFGTFDISANDQQIVFSYLKDGVSSIYEANIDGTSLRKIIGSEKGDNSYNPKYSPDGKKLVFVMNKKGSINSTLCLSNTDGSDISYLTDDKHIITEASFSLNGELIYFCMANVYARYSPLAPKNAHDFDIYSFHIKDKKIQKITNLKSYGLRNISDLNESYILMRLEAGPDGGMYLCAKDSATASKLLIPVNNPRKYSSFYYTPIYADNLKTIGFTAPYEIYIMNVEDMVAKLVFSNKGDTNLGYIAFYKNQKKMLFSKFRSPDLFSININGTGLRTIPITIE